MTHWFLLLAAAAELSAQTVSFGVKAGSPVNDPKNQSFLESRSQARWTGGPTVEFHLPRRFSIEVDALYSKESSSASYPLKLEAGLNSYLFSAYSQLRSWEFPLLGKYRFQSGPLTPFATAGMYWRRESSEFIASYACLGPAGSCQPAGSPGFTLGGSSKGSQNRFGPVAGGGIEFKKQWLTVAPEVRVQRITGPAAYQVTAIVGFTFGR
ncbi:MAG: PorT family protein [Bryobacterales bacterium]|nr:PorT family protein [Bryobacterales bacterium]